MATTSEQKKSEGPKIETDLLVLGAGPGGYAAAFYAADLGLDVTLVDTRAKPGGVCLFEGCIPSKALLHVTSIMEQAAGAEQMGLSFGLPNVDLDKVRAYKDEIVDKLTSGLSQLQTARKVRYIRGRGRFDTDHTLSVALSAESGGAEESSSQEQSVRFQNAIIATGSEPVTLPNLPQDSDLIWDSKRALELSEIPGKLLVVGGGYIGLELGSVYSALGSEVTVVEMADSLLPGTDADLKKPVAQKMESSMAEILLNTKVMSAEVRDERVEVTLSSARQTEPLQQEFDRVLVAVGRKPSSSGMGLEEIGVDLDDKGFVRASEEGQSALEHIYAIGDVTGGAMLAHVASHSARMAVNALTGAPVVGARAVPAVVYTHPELAWAGLTETDAHKQDIPVETVKFPWQASGRALTQGDSQGLTKLILESGTGRLLGMGIVGHGAGELIAEGVLAIEMGANVEDLKMTIHPHPSLSESIMESAEMVFGTSTHMISSKILGF